MMTDPIVAAKASKIYALVDQLLGLVDRALDEQMPLHEFERTALPQVLAVGYEAVQLLLDRLGPGDVGEQCQLEDGRTLKRLPELKTCEYQSVFGLFVLQRYAYAQRKGQRAELIPLDARLSLPESKFSYLLQDFDQHMTMEQPFDRVAGTIERILGLRQHVDSLERNNHKMAEHVESFHTRQSPPPADEEGAILVETADGKGVPIRRPADAPRIEEHQPKSGPKPDRKKIATLASVYSVDRHRRTAEDVVESLFRDPQQPRPDSGDRPRPCHKRVRACLSYTLEGETLAGRPAMFGWMASEVAARSRNRDSPVVCIMDGEESLWSEIDVFQNIRQRTEVLDLLHVTPRLWQAANLFCSERKAASKFVRKRVLSLLCGKVRGVIRGLRRMAALHLVGKSRATIETICRYFEKNCQRMRYDHYLAEGYPIASGVIEGACRHVVKDRMERTGMNWVIPGAQAMLDLRCVYLSDAWDEFIDYYTQSGYLEDLDAFV